MGAGSERAEPALCEDFDSCTYLNTGEKTEQAQGPRDGAGCDRGAGREAGQIG